MSSFVSITDGVVNFINDDNEFFPLQKHAFCVRVTTPDTISVCIADSFYAISKVKIANVTAPAGPHASAQALADILNAYPYFDGMERARVDVLSSALPDGAATEATLNAISLLLAARLDVALSTRNAEATQLLVKGDTAKLDIALSALRDALKGANNRDLSTIQTELETLVNELTFSSLIGSLTETAPATDTASSGLNGRLQRIAQRLTTILGFTAPVSTANFTIEVATNTSKQLLAANSNRRSAIIYNDSAQALRIFYGTTASTANTTYIIPANSYATFDDYNGRVDGIWAAAVGNARITEMTV